MNLQKINVKLFTDSSAEPGLDPFLEIFARWRENGDDPSGWVDLADYAHVPGGPGVMLIGRRGNLSADLADPGPGLLWSNRQGLDGSLGERLGEAFRRSVGLFRRLTGEPEYPNALGPRPGFWEVVFNDRLACPNTGETDRRLRPEVSQIAARLFGSGDYTLVGPAPPPARYSLTLHSDSAGTLTDIAERLAV